MHYKALTLTQPWATLVAIGAKKIETRSWATTYRGPLLIHAAAGHGPGGRRGFQERCGTEPFCSVLNAAMKAWDTPPKSLREMAERPFMPMGAIVAVCELTDCLRIEKYSLGNSAVNGYSYAIPAKPEYDFGDYAIGRYAWLLADVRPLPEPIPAKGALGLWTWDGELPI